jgi:hypothetical protein
MSVFNSIPMVFVLLDADLICDFHKRCLCVREYYKAFGDLVGCSCASSSSVLKTYGHKPQR